MLALMRKVGISPKLYVYGKDQSRDVKIAQSIAKGEQFDLVHINKHKYCRVPANAFYELITRNYYCFDGLGNTGIFDNGSDIDTRIGRTRTCSIQLNGIGGEIYRNNGKLPNQAISVKSFIRAKYRLGDCSMGAQWLDKEDFYLNLEKKLVAALSIEEERLTRQQIEMHFPFFLYKYWTSINCSINNQFSHALTPFTEARFVYPSFRIPIKNKDYGAFHCLLIERIDRNLMQYPFTKGFDFRTKIPGARNKNIDELLLKAYYSIKTYTTNKIESPGRPIPYYLQENYLKEIFGPRNSLFINQFLSVEKIKNPDVLSRALSLESVIQDTFS